MKIPIVVSLFCFLSLSAPFAQAEIGLKHGNDVTAVLSRGSLTLQCQDSMHGGPTMGLFNCEQDLLIPGDFDYFVGPERIQGNQLTLTATHEDGSTRTKNLGYDSAKGQSSDTINLWIYTVLQRPLLDGGLNKVSYSISYKGQQTARGEFNVNVKNGGVKTCSHRGFYFSYNSNDCQNGGNFCQRYFQENNYCL